MEKQVGKFYVLRWLVELIRNGGRRTFLEIEDRILWTVWRRGDLLSMDEEKGLIHGLEKAYRYKSIRIWGVQKLFRG